MAQAAVTAAACAAALFQGLAADKAPPVDIAKVPPAAAGKFEYAKDIKPIFEKTCVKCHGTEKQKSKLRLDSLEAALKGGENGPDILPGKGAQSPLVQQVAGLVEDMMMPPEGKGDPLTKEQIGILRAWIDQGAK